MASTDNPEVTGVANDDELSTTFNQMKLSAVDFGDKRIASDLVFNVLYGTTNNAALMDSLGLKDEVDPSECLRFHGGRV